MENNKNKIFAVIAIGVLLLLLIGSTFAYFAAQGTDTSQTDVNVLTHTVDSLVFETGDALSITADQNTFAMGKGNQSDSTFARATLKANSSTNTATDHYYVYLSIDENTFEYTTEVKTAELILTINKVEGETKTPVTSIDGLNYVTVGSVSGFDITEVNDLITIANNYEITSNGTKVDEWEATLTLINLDSNQNSNSGKVFNGILLIQKEMVAAHFIKNLYTTQGANNLYHHDGTIIEDGYIIDAEDNSYRYSGGDYKVATNYSNSYDTINKIIKHEIDADTTTNPNTYNRFYLAYETPKVYYTSMKDALKKAVLDGYIVADSVDNYVCFGTDSETCDSNHLYRIIGVFNGRVKLIKADFANSDLLGNNGAFFDDYSTIDELTNDLYGASFDELIHYNGKNNLLKESSYVWINNYKSVFENTGFYNVWKYSELNTINLNTNYLNNIGTKWSNKIETATWYSSIITKKSLRYAKNAYDYELGSKKDILEPFEPFKAKIGLMYLNEYYYSALPNYWELDQTKGSCTLENGYGYFYCGDDFTSTIYENWLYLGNIETFISVQDSTNILVLGPDGAAYGNRYKGDIFMIRPTFYLKSSVVFTGGTGTSTDPYRIA